MSAFYNDAANRRGTPTLPIRAGDVAFAWDEALRRWAVLRARLIPSAPPRGLIVPRSAVPDPVVAWDCESVLTPDGRVVDVEQKCAAASAGDA